MDQEKKNLAVTEQNETQSQTKEPEYSLNDDRRVKVLSPGMLVYKRFIRNRTAVTGLVILIFMFVFSFIGGIVSPYGQDEFFYKDTELSKEFASVTYNKDYRFLTADGADFSSATQAQAMKAISESQTSFSYRDVAYTLTKEGTDFYSVQAGGQTIGLAFKDVLSASTEGTKPTFEFTYQALKAYTSGAKTFSADGNTYTIDDKGGINMGTEDVAYVSRYIVQAVMPDVFLSRDYKEKLIAAIEKGDEQFTYTDESLIIEEEEETAMPEELEGDSPLGDDGELMPLETEEETPSDGTAEYTIKKGGNHDNWSIRQASTSRQYDTYSSPSMSHWLGTDKYGMDMLTRLMYGGRVSLLIGFIVVFIETALGVVMGGLAGYFGGWVDNLIMRLVDIFYCIPSMPIIIILGAAMDQQRVDPTIRMIYLMLILGILGWAGMARLVRGQILSLREQEFMTATEAGGIRVSRRIFRHLIPNVMPQLIVSCTMGLGSVIITEATLSFLGLGVKFPFASWGNIINDVNNTFVLTTYWFIWIPAGVLLVATVLAFNLVGDGLRDAFDPKMKR